MKKTIYTMLVLGIALNTLAVSCSTEERSNEISQTTTEKNILSKMEVKNASLDKKLEYKKYYLKEATKLINELGISSKDLISLASSYESKKQQYVIYEADNFPSNVRYASPGGVAIRYYSSDVAYIANATQYGGGVYGNIPYIENSEIKYRTYFN